MAGNMQISVYHIDRRSVEEEIKNKNTQEKNQNKTYSTEEIVNFLLEENRGYHVQSLKENIEIETKGFKTKVTYMPTPPKSSTWSKFFSEILDNNADILKSKKQEESFMTFIYNEENIYAITGGYAFHKIETYLDSLFGIKILSGLIDRNTKKIKGITERNVSKSVMATTKMFRVDYSISEDEDFGKIYKEIIAQLDSKILEEKLGFSKDEVKKVQCIAKTYFKITKSIDIARVYEVIEKIDKIMNQDIDDLNKVNVLNSRNKKDKYIIDELENILIDKLYKDFNEEEEFYYDICDNDYQSFILAGNYMFRFNDCDKILESLEKEDVRKALEEIAMEKKLDISNKANFEKLIRNIRLISFDTEEEYESTNSKFIKSISAELKRTDEKFFIIEGTWFKITENYIEELNKKLAENIGDKLNSDLLNGILWGKKSIIDKKTKKSKKVYITEDEFMKNNFIRDSSTLIAHKNFIDNIEFSDLIKFDDDNKKIYFMHIKRGFGSSSRDLAYQMMFSSNLLKEMRLKGNYQKLENLYEGLDENEKSKIIKSEFIKKINEYTIVYSFVFDDEVHEKRNIGTDLDKFDTNIGKGVLLDLIKFFRDERFEFEIVQVKTEK